MISDTVKSLAENPLEVIDNKDISNDCLRICQRIYENTLSLPMETQNIQFDQLGNALSLCSVADQAGIFEKNGINKPPPPVGVYQWTTDKRALAVVDLRLTDRQSIRNANDWLATLVEIAVQMYSIPSILALQDERVTESTFQQCDECGICANGYEIGITISRLPCKHTFHRQCVVQWLCCNNSCPLCRQTTILTSSM